MVLFSGFIYVYIFHSSSTENKGHLWSLASGPQYSKSLNPSSKTPGARDTPKFWMHFARVIGPRTISYVSPQWALRDPLDSDVII